MRPGPEILIVLFIVLFQFNSFGQPAVFNNGDDATEIGIDEHFASILFFIFHGYHSKTTSI